MFPFFWTSKWKSKYMFEAKTIQRMEILVLSTLEWRMSPVTPLSFVDYIARRLALKANLCREFLRKCECLIVSVISDCRFMCYLPSAMATATMLYVMRSLEPYIGLDYPDQLVDILGINKMGTGRKHRTLHLKKKSEVSWTANPNALARNLRKSELGAVIFGCKHHTFKECLLKQIFERFIPCIQDDYTTDASRSLEGWRDEGFVYQCESLCCPSRSFSPIVLGFYELVTSGTG